MALEESINDLEIKDEEEECCICFESLENSTVLTLKCKHKLHSRCGLDWFLTEKKDSCPLCRAELDDVTPTPVASAPEPAVPVAPAPSPPRIMSVNGSIVASNFSSSQTVMLAGVVGTAGPVGYTGAVGVTGSFGYTGAVGPTPPSSSTFSWVPGPEGHEEYTQPARFYPKKKCYSSSDSSSDSDHDRRRRRNKSHTSRRGCYQKSSSDSSSDSDSDRCQYKNYTMCERCDRC